MIITFSTATKEAAFNYALVTAGIVQVMARNCMKGDLPSCYCSRAKRPQSLAAKYKWGGCGDNVQYASDFSRTFLNDPQVEKLNGSANTKRAEKLLMDNHNKEVGRQVQKRQFTFIKASTSFPSPKFVLNLRYLSYTGFYKNAQQARGIFLNDVTVI